MAGEDISQKFEGDAGSQETYPKTIQLDSFKKGFSTYKIHEKVRIVLPDSPTDTIPKQIFKGKIVSVYRQTECEGCSWRTYVNLNTEQRIPVDAISKVTRIKE